MVHEADEMLMLQAVASAKLGVTNEHGGPFGCAIVRQGKVIACNDSTNHAEVNCLREACKVLRTYDLSDCSIYTTCEQCTGLYPIPGEPCPMCWGACIWARIQAIYIGVDRRTAADFGFDDEQFYCELSSPKHLRALPLKQGILQGEIEDVSPVQKPGYLKSTPTYRRRLLMGGGVMARVSAAVFSIDEHYNGSYELVSSSNDTINAKFMNEALNAARTGLAAGQNKERECFAAVVVKDCEVIAKAYNTVLKDNDPTATAEINSLRLASAKLGSHILDGCTLYTLVEPDLMSMGAIYWSHILEVYVGISQETAAKYGFEEGLLHYKELQLRPDKRSIPTFYGIASEDCRAVFKLWQELEGKLY